MPWVQRKESEEQQVQNVQAQLPELSQRTQPECVPDACHQGSKASSLKACKGQERPAPASKGPQTLGSLSSSASTGPNCSFRHVFWRSREQSFFDFYSVALQLRGFRRASRGKPRPGLRTACCNGSIGMGSRAITLRQAAASSED